MTDVHPDWLRAFDDPIPLPDAGHYATALPKAVLERVEWQTAAEMLDPGGAG